MGARLIHGVCTYHGQWLPGDERGWRSVDHKLHSSGDYKHRPPRHEHEGLRRWMKQHLTGTPIRIAPPEMALLGSAFVCRVLHLGSTIRCLSCGPTHVHLRYDSVAADAKPELGKAKQYASLKLETRPGRIFAKDCFVEEVADLPHARNLWTYILKHAAKAGAWVWRYDRDPVPSREDLQVLLEAVRQRSRT